MGKKIGYKHGYKIIISDGFYEVIDGRTVIHFGRCDNSATVQEIANKTISVKERIVTQSKPNVYQHWKNKLIMSITMIKVIVMMREKRKRKQHQVDQ